MSVYKLKINYLSWRALLGKIKVYKHLKVSFHIKLRSMGLLTAKLPPFFVSLSQTSTALRKSLGVLSIPQCLQANHAFACQMQATGTETVLVIADDTLTDNNAINVIFL